MEDWPNLIRRHTPLVWETVYRLLGNQADAADAFQETFIAALAVAERQTVRHWEATLRHLATARAIDVLRRRYQSQRRIEPPSQWEDIVGPEPDPSQQAEDGELIEQLRLLVADLPPRQAEIYCLRFIHEWTYEQIASELEMTVNAVAVMLTRTRSRLSKLLVTRLKRNEVNHGT